MPNANQDIILKDDSGNDLFPLAHKDTSNNIIADTYAKKSDVFVSGTTSLDGSKLASNSVVSGSISSLAAGKLTATGETIGSSQGKLTDLYATAAHIDTLSGTSATATTATATTLNLGSSVLNATGITVNGQQTNWTAMRPPTTYVSNVSYSNGTLSVTVVENGTSRTDTYQITALFG